MSSVRSGHRVNRCDRGLHVIFGQLGTRCREIEVPLPFGHEPRIPAGSILIEERAQVARRVDARWEARRMEIHQRGKSERRRRRGERVLKKQQPLRRMASRQSSARIADSGDAPW